LLLAGKETKEARAFVSGKPFQPNVVGKDKRLP
jgi:hypothetical protein